MSVITCARCGQEKEAVSKTAFYRGEVREKLRANACLDCWDEWIKMQIMLINEYRLNLMDPATDDFLNKQVLAFFKLSDEDDVAGVSYVPPK
ncbi:MAG: Fe(2+)-trafficking protein [Bacteroidetes bacterium]|nr:Fe(2+)-trafficking protein [Bacteroidota bacterium]